MTLRCLFAASEVAGFAKTGGLADVAGSLPRALAGLGVDCAIIMPLYRSVRKSGLPIEPTHVTFQLAMGSLTLEGRLCRSKLPGSEIPVYLVEQPILFERDDPAQGRGIYQFTQPDGSKADYSDNCQRFGFFSRAVLEVLPRLNFWPDILHNNDWQTGLVPCYLREIYKGPGRPHRNRYAAIRTLFTIHNLAYQGTFWHLDMPLLGLPWRLFNWEQMEFHGKINFLKTGLIFSDLLTTVSPTYAREIQTSYYGCGLQGVLLQRSSRLVGIVNGADYTTWSPEVDPFLPRTYTIESVEEGKAACKAGLQETFELDREPRTPLLGIVSRLADQKGLDLVSACAEKLIRDGAQLVVLGEGDRKYHQMLQDLRAKHPRRVGVALRQDEKLAHQVEAGADIFLMPSQYEPCGLNQLYSLKYGTVPIVRATGGLSDTVVDATAQNIAFGSATGFVFVPYSPAALYTAIDRALSVYRHRPEEWRQIRATGMRQDWSWNRSAQRYLELYERLVREFD